MKTMKRKTFIKALCMLLALVTVMLAAFSCKKDKEDEDEGSDSTVDTSGDSTENVDWRLCLPTANFNGAEVNIYCLDAREDMFHNVVEDYSEGSIYDKAVFARNTTIEERYDVVIDVYAKSNKKDEFVTMCSAAALSGECDYDIIETERFFSLEKDGYLLNLRDYDVLKFDNPYWVQGYNDKTTINGKTYSAVGYMNRCIISNAEVIFGNYYKLSDLKIRSEILDLIGKNEWTLEKMSQYMAMATEDVDGDGLDFNDSFGLSYNLHAGRSFLLSAGLELLSVDSQGNVTNNATSTRNSDIFDLVKKVLITNQHSYYKNNRLLEAAEAPGQVFVSGRSLFHAESFDFVSYAADAYSKFDIYPMPLYEAGKDYVTALKECTSSAIHINAKDPTMSATIIEAMNILSYLDVMPVYYDKMLKGRYSSDPEVASMVELIVDHINIDFAFVQTDYFDSIADKPFDIARENEEGYMSGMASFDKNFSQYAKNFYRAYGLISE